MFHIDFNMLTIKFSLDILIIRTPIVDIITKLLIITKLITKAQN